MKRIGVALLITLAALGIFGSAGGAEPGGNSAAAHACQKGGYQALVGTDGGFLNTGQCVSYAAHGGRFVTPEAGEFLIPAGQTATLSDTVLNACNSLTYGYRLSSGSFTAIGAKPSGCTLNPQADTTIGPFSEAVIFDLVLIDNSCGATFDSGGGHALVSGSNPFDVDITDAGGFCEAPAGTTRPPGPFGGNLSTTLTIG